MAKFIFRIFIQFFFQSFVSPELLEFIEREITSLGPNWKSLPAETVFLAIQAFSTAQYDIEALKLGSDLLENEHLKKLSPNHSTWYQFALQLLSLGVWPKELVERVLSREYLTKHLNRANAKFADYEKLSIFYGEILSSGRSIAVDHQAVNEFIDIYLEKYAKNPIRGSLVAIYGEDKVLSKIRGSNGIIIQNLLKYNAATGQMEAFQSQERDRLGYSRLEDIKCKPKETL